MRGVAAPPIATLVGGADLPAPGPLVPPSDPAAGAPAGARSLPFAAMLATQLGGPNAGPPAKPAPGPAADRATGSDAEQAADGGPHAAPHNAADPLALLAEPPATAGPAPSGAASGAAPARAGAADVRRAVRSLDALTPELRERFGRVVARMQREHGHTVEIAETGRTQARQDYLFAQGRTRPGPVVTWTHDSNHTRGRAVDVTIDGGYDNAAAFALLQQVANSEGLHTLGARDPGHLELPRNVPGEVAAAGMSGDADTRVVVESFGVRTEPAAAVRGQPSGVPAAAPLAGAGAVATVAAVAAVAPVAQVAAVAQVAPLAPAPVQATTASASVTAAVAPAPDRDQARSSRGRAHRADAAQQVDGAATRDTTFGPNAPAVARPTPVRARADARPDDHARGQYDASAGGELLPRQSASPTAAATDVSAPAGAQAAASAPAASLTASTPSPATPAAPAPSLGAVAAERIARVLDAQQAAAPQTVSHLTLRVERAEGGEDRIRLDLRGRTVDARIDVADLGAADDLAGRTPELRAALARHGLTTDDIDVRQTAAGAGRASAADATGSARIAAADADLRTAVAPNGIGDGAVAGLGAAPAQTGDGATRDPARDHPAREQTPRDADARDGRRSDDQSSGGRPSGDAERRPGDGRRERRPPARAFPDPR